MSRLAGIASAIAAAMCAIQLAPMAAECAPDAPVPANEAPWQWHVPGEGRGTPALANDAVYVLSKNHEVLAIDRCSGRTRWRASTGGSEGMTSGSALRVLGATVVVGDETLIALHRATGSMRWRVTAPELHGLGEYLGDMAGTTVLAGSTSGHLVAIDANDGTPKWSTPVTTRPETTVFAPIATGDSAIAGFTVFGPQNRGGVVALDLVSGRVRWCSMLPVPADETLGTDVAGGPLVVGELVIVASADGTIYALRVADGEVAWSIPRVAGLPANALVRPDQDFRALVQVSSTLIAGSLTGAVIAYDLTTRAERWRHYDRLDGSVAFRLGVDVDTVYVPFLSGHLLALNAEDGTPRWRVGDSTMALLWPPAVGDDYLYLSSGRKGFYARRR